MKSRVITALLIMAVLIPIVYISPLSFRAFALFIGITGIYEFLNIFKEKKFSVLSQGIIYAITVISLLFINSYENINVAVIGLWIFLLYFLMIIDKNIKFHELSYIFTFTMFFVMSAGCAILIRNLDQGFYAILFIVLVTAASDTGAFFVGKTVGKHKLIERISPNKTIEGSIGGIILGLIIGMLYYMFLPTPLNSILEAIIVSLILSATGQCGDLFFSSIKRNFNIKDFSNFLPGHGGILDRIDSHMTNFLVFAILMVLMKGSL